MGDLNAKTTNLPSLKDALEVGDWFDTATIPHLQETWQQNEDGTTNFPKQQPLPNCWAHGGKKPTRRTFIFCNRRGLGMLQWAATGPWGQFDVHAMQGVGIKPITPAMGNRIRHLQSLHPEEPDDSSPDHTGAATLPATGPSRNQEGEKRPGKKNGRPKSNSTWKLPSLNVPDRWTKH